jgi:hypothetical protein
MLDKLIPDMYKVLNDPNLTGWNALMSICDILDQLMANYRMPDTMVLFNNDTLFCSPFPLTEAPNTLFYQIKQCQEIQTIGQDLYLTTFIINVAICILMQFGFFPIKEFKTWVVTPNKMFPLLKTFIHEVYTRRLMEISLCNTAGQLGYVANQNMFTILNNDAVDVDTDSNAKTVTQTAAAATTGSTLSSTYATITSTAFPAEVTAAIKLLSANQSAIMQQMVALSFAPPPTQCGNMQVPQMPTMHHVPPIQHINIPAHQSGGFQLGHGGRQGGRHSGGRGWYDQPSGRMCTPFANHLLQCKRHAPILWPPK